MGSVILAILRSLEIVGYTISIPAERALGTLAGGWGGYMTILDKPGRFILIQ